MAEPSLQTALGLMWYSITCGLVLVCSALSTTSVLRIGFPPASKCHTIGKVEFIRSLMSSSLPLTFSTLKFAGKLLMGHRSVPPDGTRSYGSALTSFFDDDAWALLPEDWSKPPPLLELQAVNAMETTASVATPTFAFFLTLPPRSCRMGHFARSVSLPGACYAPVPSVSTLTGSVCYRLGLWLSRRRNEAQPSCRDGAVSTTSRTLAKWQAAR